MKTKLLLISSSVLFFLVAFFSCTDSTNAEINDMNGKALAPLSLKTSTTELDYNTFGFYYNWYGNPEFDNGYNHWGHHIEPAPGTSTSPGVIHGADGDVAANFFPQLEAYSSKDPAVIQKHMEMFVQAKVGVVALSWWNEVGTSEPEKISMLLDEANKHGLKVCFHIEPYGNRNAQNMKESIKHLIDTYGNHPSFYRLDGKPMFFIYDSYLTPASEWATLLKAGRQYSIRNTAYDSHVIGLWLEPIQQQGAKILEANFDGFYTYFSAEGFTSGSTTSNWAAIQQWAVNNSKIFIPSVGPGYIDTRIRPWNNSTTRARNNGQYYDNMYQKAIDSGASYISITSFNEWHEGSQIEPAIPYSSATFTYEDYRNVAPDYYLHRTAYWVNNFLQSEQRAPVELFVDGRQGGYIDFGQSSDYSNFGNSGEQAFTVELWAKLKHTEDFGSIVSCFNEDGNTQTRKGWIINNFDNSRIRMTLGLDNWGLLEPGFNFSATEEWVHIAAVVDEKGINGEHIDGKAVVVKVYQNGVLKDQSTASDGKNYLSNYLNTSMVAFGQPAGVGGMTADWRLSGYIKDFHIWKSAKSEDEIKKLRNKQIKVTGQEPDLVCGWEFTSKTSNHSNVISDLTGKHSATLVGTYSWITTR